MIIGAVKESLPGERRVAATPQSVAKLIKLGYGVVVESGCGSGANFPDALYVKADSLVQLANRFARRPGLENRKEGLTSAWGRNVPTGAIVSRCQWVPPEEQRRSMRPKLTLPFTWEPTDRW